MDATPHGIPSTPSSDDILDLCLFAGVLVLKNGGETYRAEETMVRMAMASGVQEAHGFATPTGVFLSCVTAEGVKTRVQRIAARTVDLSKVAAVNEISRCYVDGRMTAAEAFRQLKRVETAPFPYGDGLAHLAAGATSASFALLFGGSWPDFGPAFAAGLVANVALKLVERLFAMRFVAEAVAAFFSALTTVLAFAAGWGADRDAILIGALMPFVPGVALTNAVRDVMAGDLVSGLARGAEAALTALAVAAGVALLLGLVAE